MFTLSFVGLICHGACIKFSKNGVIRTKIFEAQRKVTALHTGKHNIKDYIIAAQY